VTLALAAAWSLLLARPAAAHLDPPGAPTILVTVDFQTGQLTEDQDDGGGDAELLFIFKIGNAAHGQQVETLEADVDWDETAGHFTPTKRLYEHLECFPAEPLALNVKLVEVDTFGVPEAVKGIASAAAAIEESLSPLSYLFGLLSGLEYLNGDDDLGEATLVLDAAGSFIELRGEDGGCDFSVSRFEYPRDWPPCDSPGNGRGPQGAKAGAAFRALGNVVAVARTFTPEPGNPLSPGPAELADMSASASGLAADLANLAAADAVDAARPFDGVDHAAVRYARALEERAAGDLEAAIRDFGLAHDAATRATERGRPRDEALPPETFPLDVVVAPAFISTRSGRQVTVGGGVVGRQPGQQLLGVTVLGLPPGAFAVPQLDTPGSFHVDLDLAAAPLGTFPLQLQLQVGPDVLVEPLVVAVHQR